MSVLKVGFFNDVTSPNYKNKFEQTSVAKAAYNIEHGIREENTYKDYNPQTKERFVNDHTREIAFMDYTKEKYKEEWINLVKEKIMKEVKSSGKVDFNCCLKDLGEKVKLNIKETMNEGESLFGAIADNYPAWRDFRGVENITNPLVATGGLRDSVEARIE